MSTLFDGFLFARSMNKRRRRRRGREAMRKSHPCVNQAPSLVDDEERETSGWHRAQQMLLSLSLLLPLLPTPPAPPPAPYSSLSSSQKEVGREQATDPS
jgi:hypothetical protein